MTAHHAPWMGDTEIALIENHLTPQSRVLEWGAGGSTVYFSEMVATYASIEHDRQWANQVAKHAPKAMVHLVENRNDPFHGVVYPKDYGKLWRDYVEYPRTICMDFDVILIDGRARLFCAIEATRHLKPGGIIFIHDYFDRPRYHPVTQFLKMVAQANDGQGLAAFQACSAAT